MPSVKTSGTQAATLNTEHTLATVTDPGTYQLLVDCAALTGSDVVELRIYTKVLAGGTERLYHRATYGPTALAVPAVASIPIVSPREIRATLKQIAGTGRSFPWTIDEL